VTNKEMTASATGLCSVETRRWVEI